MKEWLKSLLYGFIIVFISSCVIASGVSIYAIVLLWPKFSGFLYLIGAALFIIFAIVAVNLMVLLGRLTLLQDDSNDMIGMLVNKVSDLNEENDKLLDELNDYKNARDVRFGLHNK